MIKKEKIQIGIVLCSVLLIIIAIAKDTYAYYLDTFMGNDIKKDAIITTGTMKIVYTNTQGITGGELLPGWKSEVKTFTVSNVGTLPVTYDIKLANVTNTFSKPEELVFQLTGDNEITIKEQQFPATDDIVVSKISIEPNTTHTYTMQVTFKELKIKQDYNQGSSFSGKIEIAETEFAKAIADFGIDESGAEAPVLNNGLIPVTWNGSTWVKADTSKAWYNYDKQAWANAVTVTSSTRSTYTSAAVNTPINMNDIETMWVWIPRYEYYIPEGTAGEETEIYGTKSYLNPGEITINFISKETITSSSVNFTIHDAFWWDNDNNGVKRVDEQLSGIWVAKFEMSAAKPTSNTLQNPIIKPNVTSWRIAQIGTFWTAIHNNMNGESNTYGLSNSDAHLMKNMEWGAVAYLSQSKYGKYGNPDYTGANKEIYQNKSEGYITGSSNGTPGQKEYNIQSTYDIEEKGTGASTTGNIYGIYDMNGGAWEYVMGVMKESTNTEPTVGYITVYDSGYSSGWSGKLASGKDHTGTYGRLADDPETKEVIEGIGSKYYDLYDYGTSSSDLTRYHKGDATYETVGWYSDYADFVYHTMPFFRRGGYESNTANAGVFSFSAYIGGSNQLCSGRPVLVQIN